MKAKVPKTYTREYMDEYITHLDMACLMVLHEEFGFGAERLKRYYRAIMPMADRYRKYDTPGEPDWGQKSKDGKCRMSLWKQKKDLHDIGFEYDEIVAEENEKSARELEKARKGIKEKR